MMALTTLYSMRNHIIESLMVIGYDPSHSTASLEVNAPLKILSTLIRCLKNEILQEIVKERKTNIDDLNYEDYVEQDDMNGMKDLNDGIDIREEMEFKEEDTKEEVDQTKETTDKLDVGMDEFKDLEKEEQEEILQSKLNFVVNINYITFNLESKRYWRLLKGPRNRISQVCYRNDGKKQIKQYLTTNYFT